MPHDDWWARLADWARGRGWNPVLIEQNDPLNVVRSWYWAEAGYYIASGPCERGSRHACVYRDGGLVHDPHPSRAGLLSADTWTLFAPLDPATADPAELERLRHFETFLRERAEQASGFKLATAIIQADRLWRGSKTLREAAR
jgi:hypothetical protein